MLTVETDLNCKAHIRLIDVLSGHKNFKN